MATAWTLIILWTAYSRPMSSTAEFDTFFACKAAMEVIKKDLKESGVAPPVLILSANCHKK